MVSTLGREREAAFAAERDAVEAAAHEIGVGGHLPGGGAARGSGRAAARTSAASMSGSGLRCSGDADHSLISTWMVLTPETTISPASISISRDLRIAGLLTPARLDCEPARIMATEGGGSGRSAPSSWKAGSARQTRTYAFVFGCRLLTVEISCAGGARVEAEDLAEVGDVGDVGVGDGEVKRSRARRRSGRRTPPGGRSRRRFRR